MVAAAAVMPGVAGAQAPDAPFSGDLPSRGGVALLTATQDVTPDALDVSLGEAGCPVISISITEEGRWWVHIPNAPDFVNALFPAQVDSGAGFLALCATPAAPGDGEQTAEDAVAVVEAYFALLDAGEYADAYDLWRHAPDGQTVQEFTDGYVDTASVAVDVGEPGRIDPGAGQRYIPVPVVVTATLDDGTLQVFEGEIVLHHTADIPGATDEQRAWRLYSADLVQTN